MTSFLPLNKRSPVLPAVHCHDHHRVQQYVKHMIHWLLSAHSHTPHDVSVRGVIRAVDLLFGESVRNTGSWGLEA